MTRNGKLRFLLLALGMGALWIGTDGRPGLASSSGRQADLAAIVQSRAGMPLSFEPNRGQMDERAHFRGRGAGYTVFAVDDGLALSFGADDRPVTIRLGDTRTAGAYAGVDPLPGKLHYYGAGVSLQEVTNVPTYAKVRRPEIYPGIDLVFYGRGRQLEFDFVVAPGSDPGAIRFRIEGAEVLRLDDAGDLVIETQAGELRQKAPYAYQEFEGEARPAPARYKLLEDNEIEFEVGEHDSGRPLIIDPVIVYSAAIGSDTTATDSVSDIAADENGATYIIGASGNQNFPFTAGTPSFPFNAPFLTKIAPDGQTLEYSVFVQPVNGGIGFNGLALDSQNNAYVVGGTTMASLPVTAGAFDTSCGTCTGGLSSAGFLLKFNAGGSRVYGTFLEGAGSTDSDAFDVAVDLSGDAYIVGAIKGFGVDEQGPPASPGFPVSPGAFQETYRGGLSGNLPLFDYFVFKLRPAGQGLLDRIYATYLGGPADENTGSFRPRIAIERGCSQDCAAYVGGTTGPGYPTTTGALEEQLNSGQAAVVTKLSPDGTAAEYSTYVLQGGLSTSTLKGLDVDANGFAYATGERDSLGVAFKLNQTGSALWYDTHYAGQLFSTPSDAVVDALGNLHIVGTTTAPAFPVVEPLQPNAANFNQQDLFVLTLDSLGSGLTFSTTYGGSGLEGVPIRLALSHDDALETLTRHVTGNTRSGDFPVTPFDCPTAQPPGVYDGCLELAVNGAVNDVFVLKIGPANLAPVARAIVTPSPAECEGPFGAMLQLDGRQSFDPNLDPLTYTWDVPGGQVLGEIQQAPAPLGQHAIRLVVRDPFGLTGVDVANVLVQDTTPPSLELTAHSVTVVLASASDTTAFVDVLTAAGPIVADICDPNPFVFVSGGQTQFPVGETTVDILARDDSGTFSRLPFTVNVMPAPLPQDKLIPLDGTGDDRFGHAVSFSGPRALIGSPLHDGAGSDAGAAYVFRFDRLSDQWVEEAKLTASDTATLDQLGVAVSLDGDRALVGAPFNGSGAVYIFRRVAEQWMEEAKLTGPGAFGVAVSLSGDRALIGATNDLAGPGLNTGAAYVFHRNPTTGEWTQEAKLVGSDTPLNPRAHMGGVRFGTAVSLDGGRALVGASFGEDAEGVQSGAAYLFERNSATGQWNGQAKLTAEDIPGGGQFGGAVSIVGDRALVSARFFSGPRWSAIFRRDAGSGQWIEEARLMPAGAAPGDLFGRSVSLDQDLALVGAPAEGAFETSPGSAFLFRFDEAAGQWRQERKLSPADGVPADSFGVSAALSADGALVGARFDDPSGSAYFYHFDSDGDDVSNLADNCPVDFNPDQEDDDQDGLGNVCAFNTPLGNNVTVSPVDQTTGMTPLTVTFSQVLQAGQTSLVTSDVGPAPPEGYQLGAPPLFYEISTTAGYRPPVTVCINYNEGSFSDESTLALFHFENGVWMDRTASHDSANNQICAVTDSLSPFAIFELTWPSQPELKPIQIQPRPMVSGNGVVNFELNGFVKNFGGVEASPVRVRFAYSADSGATFQNIGTNIDLGAIPSLGTGQAIRNWNNVALGSYLLHLTVDPNNNVPEGDETNNVAIVPLEVRSDLLSDLFVRLMTPRPRADNGGNIDMGLSTELHNIGNAHADNVRVRFEISQDGGATYSALGSLVNAGQIQAGRIAVVEGTFPNAPIGDYLIRVTVDPNGTIAESNETNNQAVFPLTVGENLLADLVIASLTATAAPDDVGNIDITIEAVVRNPGFAQAPAVKVQFLISSDGGATFEQVGALAGVGNIAQDQAVSTRIAQNVSVGDYIVKAVVDPNDAIAERDETNNERTIPVNVPLELLPDLAVQNLTSDAAPDAGGNIDVTLEALISNSGPTHAKSVKARFAFSDDGGASFTDIGAPVGVGNVESGSAAAAQRVWQNVVPGNYLVRVTADPANLVPESNEANNAKTAPVNVPIDLLPELSIASLGATPEAQADNGIRVTLTAAVQNNGPAKATQVGVQFLVSNDGGVSYAPIGGLAGVGGVEPGASGTAVRVWNNVSPGTYLIRAVADPENLVPESNETNNEHSIPATVPIDLLPDLIVAAPSATSTPDANGNIDVTLEAIVSNIGPSKASTVRVEFSYSADGGVTFHPIGGLVGLSAISGGASKAAQRVWQNVDPGAYLIRVVVDPQNVVPEVDEANNVTFVPVIIAAVAPVIVLDPDMLDFGAVTAGQTNDLIVTVRNTGSATLTVTSMTSSNARFAPILLSTPFGVGPNSFQQVTIRFSPESAASEVGTITFTSNDPARPNAALSVKGNDDGGGANTPIALTAAAGWPNGRTSNQLPPLAIDGDINTYTWTTEAFNNENPSYLGVSLGAADTISRLRIFKDNDAGGPGLIAKNLTIEYTTSSPATPLPSRVWMPVSGLVNGHNGTELMNATAVNANGAVSADNHVSQTSGWASLTFTPVNATGLRIGFSNATPIFVNHYRVYELELYGPN